MKCSLLCEGREKGLGDGWVTNHPANYFWCRWIAFNKHSCRSQVIPSKVLLCIDWQVSTRLVSELFIGRSPLVHALCHYHESNPIQSNEKAYNLVDYSIDIRLRSLNTNNFIVRGIVDSHTFWYVLQDWAVKLKHTPSELPTARWLSFKGRNQPQTIPIFILFTFHLCISRYLTSLPSFSLADAFYR